MERSASPLERTSAGQFSLGSVGSEGAFDFFDDHDESDSNSSSSNSSSNQEDIIKELERPDKVVNYGDFKRLVYSNLNLIIHIKDNAITGYSKYFSY